MTPRNFAAVGIKLLALYIFAQAVPLFATAGFMTAFSEQLGLGRSSFFLSAFIPGLLLLLLAALLFIFAETLARRLAPPGEEPVHPICSIADVQAISFAAVGILILAIALPSLGRAVENLFSLFSSEKTPGGVYSPSFLGNCLYSFGVIAQILIGLVLLLNPRGFRNIWRWLRTAGTNAPST